jgi:adenylate cyclase
VEKNATVAANIVSQNVIKKPPVTVDVMGVLIVGIFSLIIGHRFRALHSVIGLLFLTIITVMSNQALFTFYGLRVNLVYPLFTVVTEGICIVSYKYFVEEKRSREIRRMFSSYVSPKIVKELIENPEMASPGGIRKEVTVLFSDIKDFTSLAESKRPEEVVSILNEYFQVMIDAILRWDGTLDKFMGDEIMAFWGGRLSSSLTMQSLP